MVFVAAMGEVHPHHVEASITKLVDGLNRVGLGADGADDGSPTQVASGLEFSVERRQPVNPAAQRQVLESRGSHFRGVWFWKMVWMRKRVWARQVSRFGLRER